MPEFVNMLAAGCFSLSIVDKLIDTSKVIQNRMGIKPAEEKRVIALSSLNTEAASCAVTNYGS